MCIRDSRHRVCTGGSAERGGPSVGAEASWMHSYCCSHLVRGAFVRCREEPDADVQWVWRPQVK
eukprot:14806988-Alexandrium_andersonii.AAC.1